MRIGFNTLFSSDSFSEKISKAFLKLDLSIETVASDLSALSDGSVDAFVYPMHLLTEEQSFGLKKSALLDLGARNYNLLIPSEKLDPSNRFGFPQSMNVHHPVSFSTRELKALKESMSFTPVENEEIIVGVQSKRAEISVLESCFLPKDADEFYRVVELNPREFGHAPGQGFFVILTKEGSSYADLIKKMNTRETIAINNVERKISQIFDGLINVHCELGKDGYFQLWAFTDEGNAQIAQSTRNLIEERIIEKLQSS